MIRIENLTKTFGQKKAVDNLTFSVERGEVLGFLGPNGAGKSTTMRMITGFLPPSAGKISIGGHDVVEDSLAAKRLIGYLPENAASYPDMSVEGFLSFTAELRGMSGGEKKRAVQRVVDLCFLSSVLHQQIDTLSKGYKHRTCLAQSLIHDPEVLIMDEPTDGLDPNQKHEVRNLIREMGKTKAVIFSTHILEEVDAACTRAIIIDRGRIVANGTPAELRGMSDLAGAVTIAVIFAAGLLEVAGGRSGKIDRNLFADAPCTRACDHSLGTEFDGHLRERDVAAAIEDLFHRATALTAAVVLDWVVGLRRQPFRLVWPSAIQAGDAVLERDARSDDLER
jgi:ABC-2 type transport system ATP-binding protein